MNKNLESQSKVAFEGLVDNASNSKPETKPDTKPTQNLAKETFKSFKPNDDPKQKAKLIYQIQMYGKNSRLGSHLKSAGHRFDESYLRSLSVSDLQLELEKQDVALANRTNNSLIDTGIKGGLSFMETALHNKSKFKVKGTTDKLWQDDHFLDLLERIKLKYNLPFVQMDPMLELIITIVQTGMIMHQTNSFKEQLGTKCNLDEEIEE